MLKNALAAAVLATATLAGSAGASQADSFSFGIHVGTPGYPVARHDDRRGDWRWHHRDRRPQLSPWQIRHLLIRQGWRDVHILRHFGSTYLVRAERHRWRRDYLLTVSAYTGAVLNVRVAYR